jgi:2,3-bisphosphoglycerate-dependent phosphoglycerate mutase
VEQGKTGSPDGPTSILSEKGRQEARGRRSAAGKEGELRFDLAFTSVLNARHFERVDHPRCVDQMWIPVVETLAAERAALRAPAGLNKAETAAKHGEAQVKDLAAEL